MIGTPGFPSHSNPYLRTKVHGFKILKILCVSFQPIPMATDVFWSRDPWQMAVFHVNCTFDQSIRIKPKLLAYSRSHKRSRPDCKNQEGCWCDLSLGSSRLLTFQPLLISWISESGQIKIHFIFWKSISMRIQHILLILFYINMLQTSVRVDDVVVSMLQVQSVETWFLLIKINSFWIGQQYFLIILDGLCLILRRILTFMSIRTIPVVFAFSRDFKKSGNGRRDRFFSGSRDPENPVLNTKISSFL